MSSKKNTAKELRNEPPKEKAIKIDVNEKQKITINKKDRYKSQASFLQVSSLGFTSWKADNYRRKNFGSKSYRHSIYGFSTEHLAPRRE